ncbi:RxLR-like protein [Phytophthora cinnamomi]|uniref:RxLR-like protein n=1 Tax=Phytophthora cinnamomi TaxID=4785 RepID=UPI003559C9FB|nr:RxLR-like protein [Phytophthora cinnamomi]
MVSIRSALTFACVALVASVSATSDEHRTLQAVNFRSDLLDAINAVRKTEGLKPMCINEMLMDSAQNQANDMADGNFIKSTGSDGSTPKQRAAVEGFKAAEVTEVVGAGYRTASSIVAAWAKSASAKSTLLSKHNVMGPGYTFDKTRKYVHFWAVDFATGECGDGPAQGGPSPAGSKSGNGSGSVEYPASTPAPAPASSNDSDKDSGSGSAPAPARTPAVTPAPANSESDESGSDESGSDDDSGSGAETPAVTPAPAAAPAATPPGTAAPESQ